MNYKYKFLLPIKNLLPKFLIDIFYTLKYRNAAIPLNQQYCDAFKNKNGLEIGGPSLAFKFFLPIYKLIANLDIVNYSQETVWEGQLKNDRVEYFRNKSGNQIIAEATNLTFVNDNTYDFLISSNCLEHVANPIKALKEWSRVIKPNGYLLLVLPKKESNFDHKRPYTTFEHLIDDYNLHIEENDSTHIDEVLKLHDLDRDYMAIDYEHFKFRCLNNLQNRCIHHHVFNESLIREVFNYCEIDVIKEDETDYDYYTLGKLNKITYKNE